MVQKPKEIVSRGYDLCGLGYNEARADEPRPELALLIDVLPTGARVLDISIVNYWSASPGGSSLGGISWPRWPTRVILATPKTTSSGRPCTGATSNQNGTKLHSATLGSPFFTVVKQGTDTEASPASQQSVTR
jgi:hypothetical protein